MLLYASLSLPVYVPFRSAGSLPLIASDDCCTLGVMFKRKWFLMVLLPSLGIISTLLCKLITF